MVKEPELVSSTATVELPAEIDLWKQSDTARVQAVQTRIRREFTGWFARGYRSVGVRKSPAGMTYLLAPGSDF